MGKFRGYPVFRIFGKRFGADEAGKIMDRLEKWYTEKVDEAQFLEDWIYFENKLGMSEDEILDAFRYFSLLPSICVRMWYNHLLSPSGVFAWAGKRTGFA